jgi:hypothetical protein
VRTAILTSLPANRLREAIRLNIFLRIQFQETTAAKNEFSMRFFDQSHDESLRNITEISGKTYNT